MLSSLAVVRDIRGVAEAPASQESIEALETDLFSQFVLARSSAGLADRTIQEDINILEAIRTWLERPLWEMRPADADRYFGKAIRNKALSTRTGRAATLRLFFDYLELRHKAEIHRLTGYVVECPVDEVNNPRGRHQDVQIRIPPTDEEIETFFAGWRSELSTTRRFATGARNYTVAKLLAAVGLRINESRKLDLDDVHPGLGEFGKLHVRFGKGSNGSGPKVRLVPLIAGADRLLTWYIEDVRGRFTDEAFWEVPGTPLFPAERRTNTGGLCRVSDDTLRQAVSEAAERHLPDWRTTLTPHVLRHYCASTLYQAGMDLMAIQELLGHKWVATTMRYVHVHSRRIEDAWTQAVPRFEARLGRAQK